MPDSSDPIGLTLNDRYRLVSLLGTGASANVYLAEDTTLQRSVAVKLLQPALAGDEAFLKRFRAEARAVAALNHPNVLQVYDWGEEGSVPFLVTEYLAGGSLSDMLASGELLSPEQAAQVGQQAAAGLAYAHQRGLVHRDVKPANLLFDDEGRLRITDFGVARALAEASWTEPIGAMIGTVRYASPEQAEGLSVDGKADVYSLGLVLYEALTGEVPFVGDSPMATLRARLGQPLPHHELLGPLDAVLSEATEPEPVLRLDAAEFERRLASVEAALPPPAMLPLHLRADALGAAAAGAATTVVGFRPPSADELTQAHPVVTGPVVAGVDPTRPGPSDLAPTVVAQPFSPAEEPALRRRRRRRWPWLVALVVILAAAFGAFAVETKLFTPTVSVPSVVGLSDGKARAALSAEQLNAVYAPGVYSTTVAADHVVRQSPAPSASLKQGSSVTLVLSRGLPPVAVPALSSSYTCDQALAALNAVHLKGTCPLTSASYSATVPYGQVISYSLGSVGNPKTVPYGSTITVVISKGPPPVAVPAVSGTYATAAAALQSAGFTPAQSNQFSSTVPVGQVIGTSPASGSLQPKGTTITVYVSLGPGVTIPSGLIGEDATTAGQTLRNLGLVPAYSGKGNRVVGVSPASGQTVTKGSTVTLIIK